MYSLYTLVKQLTQPELWALFCLVGAWFLSRSVPRLVLARRLLLAGIVLFWGLSIRPVSEALSRPLELRYTPISVNRKSSHDALVVLGSGSKKEPATGSATILGTSSLEHVVCGVAMLKDGVAPRLLLAGGVGDLRGQQPPEADTMRDLAVQLGAPADAVLLESRSRTTAERAVEVRRLLPHAHRIALIDSALHLPRSAATFRKQGFAVTPVPCDYSTSAHEWDVTDFLPNARRLSNAGDAIHEYIGIAVYWATGRL